MRGVAKRIKDGIARGFKFDGCTGVPDFHVRSCCDIHDYDYQDLVKTRAQADAAFLRCMLRKAKREKTIPGKAWKTVVGLSYWVGVRLFGHFYWKGKQRETLSKILDPGGPVGSDRL